MSNGPASDFSIVISMSAATVSALQNPTGTNPPSDPFLLYAFTGVDGPPGTVPLVWFSTVNYSTTTTIAWQEFYGGYTSLTTNVAPGTTITTNFSAPMALGQTMDVSIGGIGTVVNGGTDGTISILSQTTTEYTCGVTVQNQVTNSSNPICAFPLLPGDLDVFAPIQIVALMFATQQINTGTVIEQAFAPGILINMTGQTTAQLTFDIIHGWSGPSFTSNIPATASLLPFLINSGGTTGVAARAASRMMRKLSA